MNINYPCGFSAYVMNADFSPEFVVQGTTVWVVFSFVNGQPQSTACVPFNVLTVFNSQVNNIIPRPKSGPAYLLVTVAFLSPNGKEMRPIGRGRIKVESLRTGEDAVNTMDIPHAEIQSKILCKLRFTCRLTPPAAQMPPAYVPQPGMQPQYPPYGPGYNQGQNPYGGQMMPPYGSQGMNPQMPPPYSYGNQGMNGPVPPPPSYPTPPSGYPQPQYPSPGVQPIYPAPNSSPYSSNDGMGYPPQQGSPYGSQGGMIPPMQPPMDQSSNPELVQRNPYYSNPNTNPYSNM